MASIAMGNGVSALLNYQKAMAVSSNNSANTDSLAFKTDRASFSDMFYSQSVGLGVQMNTPLKDFSQGELKPTGSPYDFAIEGEGFFKMFDPKNPDQELFTRAGEFKKDKDNKLMDKSGFQVLGIRPTVTGDLITAEHSEDLMSIIIEDDTSIKTSNTYTSDFERDARIHGPTGVSGTHYKTVDANISDIKALVYAYKTELKQYSITLEEGNPAEVSSAQSTVSFPTIATGNDEYTLEVKVNGIKLQQDFDKSVENTLNTLSDRINQLAGLTSSVDTATGELTIQSMIAGDKLNVTEAKLNLNSVVVTRDANEGGSGKALVDQLYADLQSTLEKIGGKIATNVSMIEKPQNGAVPPMETIVLDLDELNINSTLAEKLASGDPEAVASYPGFESEDGYLYLRDGTESRFLVGKLIPVHFADKTILNPEGGSMYTIIDPDVKPVFINELAVITGKFLESSNVKIADELVRLLSYQKAFEANSKSISTSDEMMKTALALKTK